MKRLMVVIALLAMGPFVAGCTPDQEQKWRDIMAKIEAGVAVGTRLVNDTLTEVCAQQQFAIPTAQTAIAIARSRGDGPRTQAAIRAINTGITAYVTACEGGTANQSLAQLASRAWRAYNAIKAAQAEASAANGA